MLTKAVMRSLDCDENEAKDYIQCEVDNLKDLRDDGDLRHTDIEDACHNLGIDNDYAFYFINLLAYS